MTDPKFCPDCGERDLQFIEVCSDDDYETKTSWVCDCTDVTIVYIVDSKGTE